MEEKIYSVKDINNEIRKITAQFFANILVEGEIASINFHNTGNIYLSLKDEESLIDGMIFKNNFRPEYRDLKEGVKVVARGAISVYLKNGRYSLNIREIKVKGQGELFERFLKLKEKLEKAGLFQQERKRSIPLFPKKIGIVTSPDGAAVKDILTVTRRRFPFADLMIIPALVQGGEEAVQSVVTAIRAANAVSGLDVLIVGRGGGSYEELSLFNDERIAYAIYESRIPVISAVGHERDYTIADFVADKRAATPSQAGELAVPDAQDLKRTSVSLFQRIENRLASLMDFAETRLTDCEPERLKALVMDKIEDHYRDLDYYHEKISLIFDRKKEWAGSEMRVLYQNLEKLNPLYILNRNYSITEDERTGKVLSSVQESTPGQKLRIILKDGQITAGVEKVTQNQSKDTNRFPSESESK